MDKALLVGTTVVFFTIMNYLKLVPYTLLGLFDGSNLATSAGSRPWGCWDILRRMLRQRIDETLFYRLCYAFLFVTGLKLLYDGVTRLMYAEIGGRA